MKRGWTAGALTSGGRVGSRSPVLALWRGSLSRSAARRRPPPSFMSIITKITADARMVVDNGALDRFHHLSPPTCSRGAPRLQMLNHGHTSRSWSIANEDSLSVGGELYVNDGQIGIQDNSTAVIRYASAIARRSTTSMARIRSRSAVNATAVRRQPSRLGRPRQPRARGSLAFGDYATPRGPIVIAFGVSRSHRVAIVSRSGRVRAPRSPTASRSEMARRPLRRRM